MINYKKSLISLATVLAIATSVSAANDYLRLASDSKDYGWVMFGVDGYAGNSQTADFSAGGSWDATLTDTGNNEAATSGLAALTGAGAPGDMVEVKALNINTTEELSAINLNMDMTGTVFSYTEPMRTMFITAPSTASEPTAMISYKASLEGETVEIQLNGSATTTYTVEISALNTFDNPALAGVKTVGGDSNSSLNAMSDVVDYDFTNNPQDSGSYIQSVHQDTDSDTTGGSARLYSYDAINGAWKIYDSKNTVAANDFTTIDKGVGYWGRMDTDGSNSNVNADTVPAGLVLGSQGIVDSDYSDNNLSDGWNLMSFDSQKPDIINASTGMILLMDAAQPITIYDSTAVNNVVVTLTGAAGTPEVDAANINLAIESAKARGVFSEAFDLRAFGSNAPTDTLVLLSNKRFFVNDNGNALNSGTSLNTFDATTNVLWNSTTEAYASYSVAGSFPLTGVLVGSVYGQYSLAFKPEVTDSNSSADLDDVATGGTLRSAAIQINEDTTNLAYLIGNDTSVAGLITVPLSSTASALNLQDSVSGGTGDATGSTIGIDIDFDGADETVLAVSDTPFYLRDHTFIRVVEYDDAADAIGDTHVISGAATAATITTTGNTIGAFVTNVNAQTDLLAKTGVYAIADGTKVIFTSATKDTNLFDVRDDDNKDLFADATTTTGYGLGAISDVYHIDSLAKQTVYPYKWELTINDKTAFDTFDSISIDICTSDLATDDNTPIAAGALGASDTLKQTFLNAFVAQARDTVVAAGNDVNIYHDFNVTSPSYPVTITMESYTNSVFGLSFGVTANECTDDDYSGTTDESSVDANGDKKGQLTSIAGDATEDLKFNAVSTKTYAQSGPLYTMKEQGYTIQAMISGNTNIDAGTVAWDSIDMTRTAREMYDSQDFNLFSIDGKAGYWTYLEANTDTNDLNVTIVSSSLTPTYKHHFDNDETTSQNSISTSLTVIVEGLDAAVNGESTERVWANVGGTTVELVGNPSTKEYTADIDTYSIASVAGATSDTDVTVSVSNGYGWLLASQSVGTIDGNKPNVPTIDLSAGFTVDSNSTDAVGYYIYKTFISEDAMHATDVTTDANYIGYVEDGAASIDFCSSSAMSFNNAITLLSVAVDGNGTFTKGNISDVASAYYYPIEKGSTHFSHLGLGAPADQFGLTYGSDCSPAAAESTTDIGVSMKSITTGTVAKLAIAAVDGVTFDLDIPYTIYVTDDTNIAEIKYDAAYANKPFYVQFDGVVYDGTLPTAADVFTYDTAGAALDLNRAAVADYNTGAAASISGQSF